MLALMRGGTKMYLRIFDNRKFGFVLDTDRKDSDIFVNDEDLEDFFCRQDNGEQFRLKETPDGNGLFGHVVAFVPAPIDMPPTENQLLQLAQAEAVEKQEADNLASQLALAEYIESQAQGGE